MEMSSKTPKIPSIRFNGFVDAWEQRKLDKVLHERKLRKKISGETPLLAFAAGQGVIDRSERKTNNRDFLTKDSSTKTYLFTKYDDIVYNPSNLKYGAIDRNKYGEGVISPIYVTFETEEVSSFIELIVRGDSFKQRALQYEEGTVTKRQSVKPESLLSLNITLPISKKEQQRIGDFFKQLDDTIALQQCQLDNYKELKTVMLKKIFNQELRFEDQVGNDYPEWKKIALNELGETYTGLSGKTKEDFGTGKGKFVTYMNVYSNPVANLTMTEKVEIDIGEKQNKVRYGDIFFTTSSENPEEVGMSSVWLSHEDNVYLNSFCFGYRLNAESESVISPEFLGFQLRAQHIRKEIIFLAQGSTRFNISKSKLMDILVYLPTMQEQKKITALLLTVDSKINQTIKHLDGLNVLKKALLQQMFI